MRLYARRWSAAVALAAYAAVALTASTASTGLSVAATPMMRSQPLTTTEDEFEAFESSGFVEETETAVFEEETETLSTETRKFDEEVPVESEEGSAAVDVKKPTPKTLKPTKKETTSSEEDEVTDVETGSDFEGSEATEVTSKPSGESSLDENEEGDVEETSKAPVTMKLAGDAITLEKPIEVVVDELGSGPYRVQHTRTAKGLFVHFSSMKLVKGDRLVVASDEGDEVTYDTSVDSDFWTRRLTGSAVTITLLPSKEVALADRKKDEFSVTADAYRVFTGATQKEGVCGADNSVPAKCLLTDDKTDSSIYLKSQAVGRMLVNGTSPCTGAILSKLGYFLTAAHCVSTDEIAKGTVIEFGAESSQCKQDSKTPLGSLGSDVLRNSELYAVNKELDYAVLKLDMSKNNVVNKFGYVTLRSSGPKKGEKLFIPHHPGAFAKRISKESDKGDLVAITDVKKIACFGNPANHVAYEADTAGGSSGAPVIGIKDMEVIALHRCGGCEGTSVDTNSGLSSKVIFDDLKRQGKAKYEFFADD
ncbi:hypothetical protein Poli38472_014010 [Pythium oligandrum]|uniref:Serine protease n=1 Tax=Pythium oligandrum TaxID=41045 RepID=A0A8K1CQV5_PYTOL|nr:hypothetical protein Poli38472_014010 [Pythium oligandrum]|eukprot:TMW66698.1 hypothetical protein Poli38472_014010 [Pythium oligandrum]